MTTDTNATTRFDSDAELVRSAQQGDSDAFASLFHSHKARIYSVCLRMTNNAAEAEDLTQDAFLQVFRKLATFRGDSALSTWLYRIAVNTVLMHFRKKVLRQISLDEPYNQDAKVVRREYGSRDDRLTGSVDRIALARATVGNSKSQLHKAKLRIRELLGRARQAEEAGHASRPARQRSRRTEDRWEREQTMPMGRLALSANQQFTATGA